VAHCDSPDPSKEYELRMRFIFHGDQIKLYTNPTLCIGWNAGIRVTTCDANDDYQRFRVDFNPNRIGWIVFQPSIWFWTGDIIHYTNSPAAGSAFFKHDPTVKHLELDASNTCAEAPRNDAGDNHELFGQVFAAECDVVNVNQRFIFHPNGNIEIGDGTFYSTGSAGWCLDVAFSSTDEGTKFHIWSCNESGAQRFVVDAAAARIRYADRPNHVLGIDNPNAAVPLLGWYKDVTNDNTKKWRTSLGDAQVMFKLEGRNLCLDTSGGQIKAATCTADTTLGCTPNPADLTQSFVLHEGDKISATLVFADGSNHCVSVVGTDVVASECQFGTAQKFRIIGQGPYIASLVNNQVFTLGASNVVDIATWTAAENQRWAMLPASVPQCETINPTLAPTVTPTYTPTYAPTYTPTFMPTLTPTCTPTLATTLTPTSLPTAVVPSAAPTLLRSRAPSTTQATLPSVAPSGMPNNLTTVVPSATPGNFTSLAPSASPTSVPTPTAVPSAIPTQGLKVTSDSFLRGEELTIIIVALLIGFVIVSVAFVMVTRRNKEILNASNAPTFVMMSPGAPVPPGSFKTEDGTLHFL
jgi:hypothetical protein